ncbi:MAG: pyridoxal phosphate-dependent aminotransferase [Candidatus Brocadiia bacterium]
MSDEMHFVPSSYMNYYIINHKKARIGLGSSGRPERTWADLEPFVAGKPLYNEHTGGAESVLVKQIVSRYGMPDKIDAMVLPGTSGANAVAIHALAPPGSTVAVEAPIYDPVYFMILAAERTVVRLDRLPQASFVPCLCAVESLLAAGNVRALFLTNHHNPSGTFLDGDFFVKLHKLLVKYDCLGIVDEVYLEFHPEWRKNTVLNFGDRYVVTASVTKVFGLGNLRVGWIAGKPDLVEKCRQMWYLMAVHNSTPSMMIASHLWDHLDSLVEEDRLSVARNKEITIEWAAKTGLEFFAPDLAPIGLIKLPKGVSDLEFARRALDDKGLFLAPGCFFGLPGTLRLGFFKGEGELREGLDTIAKLL